MQQLLSVWFAIDGRKQFIVALSAVAMFAAIIGLSRMATTPGMSLLYSGLEPRTAGDVIQSLEQRGIVFEIRNEAIFVDSSQRDQLRMLLAGEGLPANSGQGYEILDSLSGFGTTAQMFDAAYWRAKEGELARTIAASPQFATARVHISNTSSQPFRQAAAPTASVTVASAGNGISGAHAKALKYLISSAVAGMSPADVSVIDSRNGTVVQDENDAITAGAASANDRAAAIKINLERLLSAHVGQGNVIVEVFLDINTESEAITEIRFDPDSRVAISSEKEERTTSSSNARGGAVTVASNLPEGDAGSSGNSSSSQDSETIERVNYEVSETKRELLRVPGTIRRLSVAVMVDGVTTTDPETNTQTWAPRSDAEIADLRELVAAAAGFDDSRGDILTLKSLQFQQLEFAGEPAQASMLQTLNIDVMRLMQIMVLGVTSVVLGLFVLRPILTSNPVPALAMASDVPGLPNLATDAETDNPQTAGPQSVALTGVIDESSGLPPGLATIQSVPPRQFGGVEQPALPADPVERLRALITDRQDETVEILRTWIDTKKEVV